ncbi:MAG: DUF1854 domain-containing protein [Planctomycetaceae bacterium]|nr:DUF1854 domain-containing protein [Planctomycetaceae bacterium]
MSAIEKNNERIGPDPTITRFLTPDMCRIHLGNMSALHVTIVGERIYGGVFAAYAFPVGHPDGYVSLLHSHSTGEIEIGIIRDLNEFPPEQAQLVRHALSKRYFVPVIHAIDEMAWQFGLIGVDVQTDKGPRSFLMRWQQTSAVDYGHRGKVLIDVDENRYLIPDVSTLPADQQQRFVRFIYW